LKNEVDKEVEHIRSFFLHEAEVSMSRSRDQYDMESRPAESFRTSALKKQNDEEVYGPSSVTRYTGNNGPSPFLTSNQNTLQENSLASSGVKGRTTKSRLGGRGLFSEIEHSLADFKLPSRTAKKQMDIQ
jgi:hypothetical protein